MADLKLAEVMQNLKTGENPELAKLIKEQSGKLKDTDVAKFIAEKLRKTDEPSILNDVVIPTAQQTVEQVGDLLQKPQQGYQMMANYATDNDINSKSYGPAIKTILSKLPQPLQLDEQAQQALTIGADMQLDPMNAFGGVGSIGKIKLGQVTKEIENVQHAGQLRKIEELAVKSQPFAEAKKLGGVSNPLSAQDKFVEVQKAGFKPGGDAFKASLDEKLAKLRSDKAGTKLNPSSIAKEKSAFEMWAEKNPGATKQDYYKAMVPIKK